MGAGGGTFGVTDIFWNQTQWGLPTTGSVLRATDPYTLK